jgi:hypothetical protein
MSGAGDHETSRPPRERALRAPLRFLDPSEGSLPPTNYFGVDPPPGVPRRLGTRETTVCIRDLRLVDDLSWEQEGFVLANHEEGVVADFHDESLLANAYEASVRRLVGALTGARRVVVFDRTHRSSAVTGRAGPGADSVVNEAHNDYTPTSGPLRAREMLERFAPDEDLDQVLARRYVIFNVWRPTNGPIDQWPLAVCDRTTLEAQDLVDAELKWAHRTGYVAILRHDPRQRWFYAPQMTPAEALVFVCYDSAAPHGAWGAHTAFADPASSPDARVRESLETRVIALF